MAKYKQTAFSGAGKGKSGGMVVYNVKGDETWNRVRTYQEDVVQPNSVLQLSARSVFVCCGAIWKGFSAPEKAYWKALKTGVMNSYNAFMSYNCKQAAREGWMPQLEVNAQHLGTPTAPTALAASIVENCIIATWTDGTLSYTTGLHLGESAGFMPTMKNIVYCTPATDGEDRQASIPVAPGTYYLKARSGDEDGGTGAPTTSVGPLVIQ